MAKALARAPVKGGIALGTISLKGVEVEAAHRLRANVTLGAYAGRSWAGKLEAGTRLQVTW